MRTEEYVILIPTVMVKDEGVHLHYTSNAPSSSVQVVVTAQSGRVVKSFDQLKTNPNGILSFPSEGLMPGRYTCTILVNGKEKETKSFTIA